LRLGLENVAGRRIPEDFQRFEVLRLRRIFAWQIKEEEVKEFFGVKDCLFMGKTWKF
jgi:hypothetical protein